MTTFNELNLAKREKKVDHSHLQAAAEINIETL